MILAAKAIVAIGSAYLLTGLLVGLAFLIVRIERQDSSARGAYAFRPLLLPGLALLWPLVLIRWLAPPAQGPAPTSVLRHKRAHRLIWALMAVFLVTTLWLAIGIMPSSLPEQPSLRLGMAASALA